MADRKVVQGREMQMYQLTASGRRELTIEQSRWDELVRAIASGAQTA